MTRLQYLGVGIFVLLVLFLPALQNMLTPRKTKAAWYSGSWLYRDPLTIDDVQVVGGSNLTNFVVLVSITDSNLVGTAQTDGDDILFTSSDGTTQIEHDLVSYNSGTGAIVAWVQIPTLLTASDTVIYMYYGNASATAQEDPAATWDSTYSAVWHLEESSGSRSDASGNSNTLTDNNTVASGTGQVGTGADFEEASTEYLSIVDASQTGLDLTSNYTIQMWVKLEAAAARDLGILSKQSDANGIDRYEYFWGFEASAETFNIQHRLDPVGNTTVSSDFEEGTDISAGTWYFVSATFDDTNNEIIFCLNGTCDTADAMTVTPVNNDGPFLLGQAVNQGTFMDGVLDEVRIQTTERSADWIATQYNNESAPGTFLSAGAQEVDTSTSSDDPPTLWWRFDEEYGTTANDSSGNSNTGTLSGTTWVHEGPLCVLGKCMQFESVSSTDVSMGADDADLDFDITDSFTLEAWFKRQDYAGGFNGTIIAKYDAATGTDGGYLLEITSSATMRCGIGDSDTSFPQDSVTSTGALFDDMEWHHVACVKDSNSSLRLYVDGIERGTPDTSFTTVATLDNTDEFYVGTHSDGTTNDFNGLLDEIRVYRTARTAEQIKADALVGGQEQTSAAFGDGNKDFLSKRLSAWWPLNEVTANSCPSATAGDDTCDIAGTGTNLFWIGNAGPGTGKYGVGLALDGTGDYSRLTSLPTEFRSRLGRFSVCSWIKTTGTDEDIVSNGVDTNGDFLLSVNGNTLKGQIWYSGNDNAVTGVAVVNDDAWHHACMTVTATSINLYVDGILDVSQTLTGTQVILTTSLYCIGCREAADSASNFIGTIDEVMHWGRDLTDKEIAAVYTYAPTPDLHWPLNENTGTSTVNDLSKNALTGTLSGSMLSTNWVQGKYGSALKFDGVDDAITRADATYWDTYTNGSVMGWVKPTAIAAESTFDKNLAGNNLGDVGCLVQAGGTHRCAFNNGTADTNVDTTSTLTAGVWTHVAHTWEYDGTNTTFRAYFNGKLETTSTVSGSYQPFSSAVSFTISTTADHTMDDIRLYKYARNSGQIVEDMNGGHPAGGSPIGSQLVYWRLDENQGSTANNAVSTSSPGTVTAAIPATSTSGWTSSGKFNRALIFDGSDDKVAIATASDADVDFNGTEQFSLSAWIYSTTVPTSTTDEDLIIGKWDETSSQRAYRMFLENDDTDSTGRIRVEVMDESTAGNEVLSVTSSNDVITQSTWYHVVMTFGGTTSGVANSLKLYINGQYIGGNSANSSFLGMEDVTSDFTVGDYDATDSDGDLDGFTGRIDDIQVFNSVLTSEQITVVMNANSSADFATTIKETNQSNFTGNDPVLLWNLDENTGTSARDLSTLGNTGTLTNTPLWVPGKFGSGVSLAALNQHILIADDADLDFAAGGSFTIETWFKHDTASAQQIIVSKFAAAGYKLIMESDGDITCGLDYDSTWTPTDSVTSTAATYDDNQWHQAICVKNANTSLTLYIDGVSVGTPDTSLTNSTLANADPLYYGIDADGTSNDYVGQLDHLTIYNYARSRSQVSYDFNRGLPIAWWKFDDCSGSTAQDSSPSNFDGTISIGASGTNTIVGSCSGGNGAWGAGSSGKFENSLDVDGTDDAVNMGDVTDLSGNVPMTISTWVYPNATQGSASQIVSKYDTGTAGEWYVLMDASLTVQFLRECGGFTTTSSTVNLTPSTWNMVTVVYDGTSKYIYINGIFNTSASDSCSTSNTSVDVVIGAEDNGGGTTNYYKGRVDDTRIYNYALTADQIKKLYNNDASARF